MEGEAIDHHEQETREKHSSGEATESGASSEIKRQMYEVVFRVSTGNDMALNWASERVLAHNEEDAQAEAKKILDKEFPADGPLIYEIRAVKRVENQ